MLPYHARHRQSTRPAVTRPSPRPAEPLTHRETRKHEAYPAGSYGLAGDGLQRPAKEAVQGDRGAGRTWRVDRRVGADEGVGLVVYDGGPGGGDVRNMFAKLGLLPAAEDHRRVLAVLTSLRR